MEIYQNIDHFTTDLSKNANCFLRVKITARKVSSVEIQYIAVIPKLQTT